MSSTAFPSLAGLKPRITRSAIYNTLVQTVQAGTELRLRRWGGTKYRYTLSFEFLRQAGVTDEVDALVAHIEQHKGKFDSFPFTDPLDGVVRRVRYESDEIEFERVIPGSPTTGIWAVGEIELITTVLDYGLDPAQPNGNFAFGL
jgi:hypothetical protein